MDLELIVALMSLPIIIIQWLRIERLEKELVSLDTISESKEKPN